MTISLNTVNELFNALTTEDKEKFIIVIEDFKKKHNNQIKKTIGKPAIVEINFAEAIDYLIQNHFTMHS